MVKDSISALLLTYESHCNETVARNLTLPQCNARIFELNEELATRLIPVMVFVGILMVTGIAGNIIVCYVIPHRLITTRQYFLAVCLAVFDLLTCFITMPAQIGEMRFPLMYEVGFVCSGFRIVEYFCNFGSLLTLLVIAADRFNIVVHPCKRQLTVRHLKRVMAAIVVISLLAAVPTAALTGIWSADTLEPGVVSHECWIPDRMRSSVWPLAYHSFLLLVSISLCITMAVLYAKIWRWTKYLGYVAYGPGGFNTATLTPFTITVIFVLSYLLHIVLQMVLLVVHDFDKSLPTPGYVVYNLITRLYLINAMVKPIIYVTLNVRFRIQCIIILRRRHSHPSEGRDPSCQSYVPTISSERSRAYLGRSQTLSSAGRYSGPSQTLSLAGQHPDSSQTLSSAGQHPDSFQTLSVAGQHPYSSQTLSVAGQHPDSSQTLSVAGQHPDCSQTLSVIRLYPDRSQTPSVIVLYPDRSQTLSGVEQYLDCPQTLSVVEWHPDSSQTLSVIGQHHDRSQTLSVESADSKSSDGAISQELKTTEADPDS